MYRVFIDYKGRSLATPDLATEERAYEEAQALMKELRLEHAEYQDLDTDKWTYVGEDGNRYVM